MPPFIKLANDNGFVLAKEILVPLQTEFFAPEGITQLVKTIDRIKNNLNPFLIERNLLTCLIREINCHLVDTARNYLKTRFINQLFREMGLSEAPSHGQPCVTYDKTCSGSKAYFKLAEEFKQTNKIGSAAWTQKNSLERVYQLYLRQKSSENADKTAKYENSAYWWVIRNKYQPRTIFDEKLEELSQSIKNGMIQPIAVRKNKSSSEPFEIVVERRWFAAQKPDCKFYNNLDLNDSETLEVAIVENIQREDLNIVEEAKGYKRLHDEFGYDQDKIANMMSKSRSHK